MAIFAIINMAIFIAIDIIKISFHNISTDEDDESTKDGEEIVELTAQTVGILSWFL